MGRLAGRPLRSRGRSRVDAEGELYHAPAGLRYVWALLGLLVVLEAINGLFGVGGPATLYRTWFQNGVVGASAALMLARAAYVQSARRAWLAFGLATTVWWLGNITWTVVYGSVAHPPDPSFADILWLLWYPLMAVGIVCLIRVRVRNFSLHRWMDGLAVMLVVLAAGFALVIEPETDHFVHGTLAGVVAFSYPVLDVLLVGTILGVYGLLGWRPDRMWLLLGAGSVAMAIADSIYAVQDARGSANNEPYAFVWTLGVVLLAYAAWVRAPASLADSSGEVTGLRAVALPLLAQALAIGIQIYAFFVEIGRSERIVTAIVLVVASVQIILTRPRAGAAVSEAAAAKTAPPTPAPPEPGADPAHSAPVRSPARSP